MNIKHSSFTFISLILLAFTAGCSVLFSSGNPTANNSERSTICNYDIPKGYTQQFSVSIADMNVISLVGQEESSHIYLVGLPDDVDIDLTNNSVGVLVGRKDNERQILQTIDKQTITIHNQQVTLVISEGENANNQRYREATAVFQSNAGQTLVNISSTLTNWDQEMVTKFLASLN